MKRLISIIACVFLMSLMGCVTTGTTGPSTCETAPPDSLLCKLADKSGVSLETIGDTLHFGAAIAIELKKYTVEDAVEVAQGVKAAIAVPGVTDIDFLDALTKSDYAKRHPLVTIAARKYFNTGTLNTGLPISQWDLDTINSYLDKTIALFGG